MSIMCTLSALKPSVTLYRWGNPGLVAEIRAAMTGADQGQEGPSPKRARTEEGSGNEAAEVAREVGDEPVFGPPAVEGIVLKLQVRGWVWRRRPPFWGGAQHVSILLYS